MQLSSTRGRRRNVQRSNRHCKGDQGGKWENSGKIVMTRYHFWFNSIVKTRPVSTQAVFYEREQSVLKYESHLPGEGAREAQRSSTVGENMQILLFLSKKEKQGF